MERAAAACRVGRAAAPGRGDGRFVCSYSRKMSQPFWPCGQLARRRVFWNSLVLGTLREWCGRDEAVSWLPASRTRWAHHAPDVTSMSLTARSGMSNHLPCYGTLYHWRTPRAKCPRYPHRRPAWEYRCTGGKKGAASCRLWEVWTNLPHSHYWAHCITWRRTVDYHKYSRAGQATCFCAPSRLVGHAPPLIFAPGMLRCR